MYSRALRVMFSRALRKRPSSFASFENRLSSVPRLATAPAGTSDFTYLRLRNCTISSCSAGFASRGDLKQAAMFDEENAVTIFSTGSFSMLTFCIFVVSVAINKYEEDKRIVSKLIEPPSVIVAPSNEFCNGFLYLVVVYTRVNEPEARNRFRNSYGTLCSKYNFTVLFPLGTGDGEVNNAVIQEYQKFGDILQTNFVDSFRNLTLKSYSLSNFVRENCTSVRAVLKLDDDVEWNVQKMVAKMATVDVKGKRLYCEVPPCGIPQRLRGGKYFISWEEWPHQFFPPYCVSAAYFGSPHTFVVLHDKTSMAPHIWLDDVFSTGVVGSAAGVSYEKLNFTKKYSHTEFLKGRTLTYGVVKGKRINRTFIFEAINGRTT